MVSIISTTKKNEIIHKHTNISYRHTIVCLYSTRQNKKIPYCISKVFATKRRHKWTSLRFMTWWLFKRLYDFSLPLSIHDFFNSTKSFIFSKSKFLSLITRWSLNLSKSKIWSNIPSSAKIHFTQSLSFTDKFSVGEKLIWEPFPNNFKNHFFCIYSINISLIHSFWSSSSRICLEIFTYSSVSHLIVFSLSSHPTTSSSYFIWVHKGHIEKYSQYLQNLFSCGLKIVVSHIL